MKSLNKTKIHRVKLSELRMSICVFKFKSSSSIICNIYNIYDCL